MVQKHLTYIYIYLLYAYIYIYIYTKNYLVCSLLIKTLVSQVGQYCYHAAVNNSPRLLIKIWGWYKLYGVKKSNHYGESTRSDTVIFRLNYAGKSLPNVSSRDIFRKTLNHRYCKNYKQTTRIKYGYLHK